MWLSPVTKAIRTAGRMKGGTPPQNSTTPPPNQLHQAWPKAISGTAAVARALGSGAAAFAGETGTLPSLLCGGGEWPHGAFRRRARRRCRRVVGERLFPSAAACLARASSANARAAARPSHQRKNPAALTVLPLKGSHRGPRKRAWSLAMAWARASQSATASNDRASWPSMAGGARWSVAASSSNPGRIRSVSMQGARVQKRDMQPGIALAGLYARRASILPGCLLLPSVSR